MPRLSWDTSDLDGLTADTWLDRATQQMEQVLAPLKPAPAPEPTPPASQPSFSDHAAWMPWLAPKTAEPATASPPDLSLSSLAAWTPWATPKPAPSGLPDMAGRGSGYALSAMPTGGTAGGVQPNGAIDNSSREAFVRTAYPYALQAAGGDVNRANQQLALAISENGAIGTGKDLGQAMGFNFSGVHAQPGEPSFQATDAGRPTSFRSYATPAEGLNGFFDFLQNNPRYAPALARYRQTGDVDELTAAANAQGYSESPGWQDNIRSIRTSQVEPITAGLSTSAPKQPATNGVASRQTVSHPPADDVAQSALDDPDKWALCGPVAAMIAAGRRGAGWTIQQAKQIASSAGLWDASTGMHGLQSEVDLLNRMGVSSRTGQANEQQLAADAQAGNTPVVSTNRHYFILTNYNPQDGTFDTTTTGTALKGGARRLTLAQIDQLGGGIQGAAYMDNPASPISSVVAPPTAAPAANGAADSPPSVPAVAAPTPPSAAGTPTQPEPVAPWAGAGSGEPGMGDMQRQPLSPTQGPDTATGDQQPYDPRDADQGAHEAGYTGAGGLQPAGRVGADPASFSTAPAGAPGVPASSSSNGAAPSPADDPGGAGFAAADAYSAPSQPYSPYGDQPDAAHRVGPDTSPTAPTSTMLPVWDDNGTVIGYRRSPAPEQRQNQQRQADGYGAVSSTPGEPDYVPSPPNRLQDAVTPAAEVYGRATDAVNQQEDAFQQRSEQRMASEIGRQITAPLNAITRGVRLATAIVQATPEATAETVNAALGAVGLGRDTYGVDTPLGRVGIGDAALALAPNTTVQAVMGAGMPIAHGRAGGTDILERGANAAVGAARDLFQSAGRGIRGAISANAERVGAADARMAEAGSTDAHGTLGVVTGNPLEANTAAGTRVIPPHVSDTLDFPIRVPTDPSVIKAIEAAGGSVDPERGVNLNAIRYEGPEAHGRPATRSQVFYTTGKPGEASPYAAGEGASVGGPDRIEAPTTYRSPLVLSDAPGSNTGFDQGAQQLGISRPGGAPEEIAAAQARLEAARAQLEQARSAQVPMLNGPSESVAQQNVQDALAEVMRARGGLPITGRSIDAAISAARRAGPPGSPERAQALKDLVGRYGGDVDRVDELLAVRGADHSESVWAIKENILAHNARAKGYDGVLTVQQDMSPSEYSKAVEAAIQAHPDYQAAGGAATAAYAKYKSARGPRKADLYSEWQDATDKVAKVHDRLADTVDVPSSHKITELADFRESHNPTPGGSVISGPEWTAAHQKVSDLSEQLDEAGAAMDYAESHGSEDGWRSARSQYEYVRKRFDDAVAAREALRDGPPGYTLRSDLPRRNIDPAQQLADARAALGAAQQQYSDAIETGDRSKIDAALQAVVQAKDTVDALVQEYGTKLPKADAATMGAMTPEDFGAPKSPGVWGALGRTANNEALNAAGGAFAGNVMGGTGPGSDDQNPADIARNTALGVAGAVLLRHGPKRLMNHEGGALATLGHVPEGERPPRYDPRLAQEPVLPGMESPRGKVRLPNVSDTPNRSPVLGDVPPSAIREPALPGMEAPNRPYEQVGPLAQSDAPNGPAQLGNVPPSQVKTPQLPGMEAPYRKPQIPDVSPEPNIGSRPGANEGGYTPALPGTEHIDPLTDPTPFIPPNERSLLPSNSLQTAPQIVENVLRQEQAQARRLARASASNPQTGQTSLPAVPQATTLVQRIRVATEPWERRLNITRYAGMFSDTAIHIFNLTSNMVMQGVDVAATPVAAALDAGRSAITGKPRQVFLSEAPARVAGMRAGLKVGLQNAAEILRTGLSPVDAAKQLEGGASGVASGNAAVDFAFEAPLRALAASDAVFRTAAQGGHLAAEGMAAAMQANPGVKITADMLREGMKDPALLERAQKLAARSVLQEDRTVTTAYQKFVQALGPEGRLLISTELPFVKTPYNVVAQGVGLTPAGLLGVVQDMAEHKPAREIEYRVARVALGTAVMAVAAADYASGNLTGPRPTDPKELSTLPLGWQPWSQKIPVPGGGTYYLPLSLLGPLALPPVAAILMGESAKKGGDMTARAGRVALGVGQYASQNTFFQSLSNIGGLLDQRDAEHNIERNIQQIVSQFSPHIIGGGGLGRDIQRVMGMPMRDPQGALEALLATHPLTAGRVEPRQDVLGRPFTPYASGPVAAIARLGKQNDAGVIQAFRFAREGLPMAAPKQIRDPSQDAMTTLTARQQHQWRRVFGQALQEDWNNNGNPQDGDALRRLSGKARDVADQTVLGLR